ncbi:MAG: pro-sigmaK processing inhibitor BofA family protein [Gemmiger sp.]|uniref:Pro-sigmaK processing inhibitor BofA family protein n=1 Tax=Subdoligranulum variabile TaxID=214851 RepID=A0A921IK94_9FIRM|nr:pro-sigmaK processing inhibitor BofA family protein [Gemmiger sp.]MEE0707621.1 pro-sigmaK processing inhibitor BofA family protein [Gemmiger sp.]HJG27323.1 pro-sigmaK processing inhibitor BofA family protein [Subdoligranulum variabile]
MMNWWSMGGAAVCLLVVGRCAAHQHHPLRGLLAGAVCGLGALALLALLDPVTGVSLPLTPFTSFTAVVLGVPGVITLLILQLLL